MILLAAIAGICFVLAVAGLVAGAWESYERRDARKRTRPWRLP